MLKKFNVLVVLAALAGVVGIVLVMNRGSSRKGGPTIKGKEFSIYGHDYTLARLAQVAAELKHPEAFTYDPKARQATAFASLIIYGSLQIGDPSDPKLGETLLLNTVVCGDLRVEVARGGELRIFNSTLQTVSQVLTEEKCSRGYYFVTDGTLKVADSRILYMSGARGPTAMANAQTDIERTTFALSDDCSFHTYLVDGRRMAIRDSKFQCEGAYGVWVEGTGGAPLRLERCTLSGSESDLYLSGDRPAVDLVDCRFGRAKVRFNQSSGRVAICWSLDVKAVERGSGMPVPGIEIVATATGRGGAETVRGRTDAGGACRLVLTEYNALPDSPTGISAGGAVTPHRIVVLSRDGKVAAEVKSHEVRGSGGTLTLEIPADALASRP